MADWFMVAITAIYVVATIVICIFNGKSAKAAKEQTETAKQQIATMIQQYNESNRPIVVVRFEIIRSGLLCFVIENIGPVAAKDVRIQINEEFISNLEKVDKQTHLREESKATLFLSSRQRFYIMIGGQPEFSEIATETAKFNITYNGKYNEHTEIDLWQYRFMLVYNSELEDISQHLKKLEAEEKAYHNKHLKELSRNGPVHVLLHSNDESQKFEVYKAVCMNPGSTAEQLSEIVNLSKENVLNILVELDRLDNFISHAGLDNDHYTWYKR